LKTTLAHSKTWTVLNLLVKLIKFTDFARGLRVDIDQLRRNARIDWPLFSLFISSQLTVLNSMKTP